MHISIITLFPEMFSGAFDASIIKRAKEKGKLEIHLVNLRDFASDAYGSVDDHPYGGGTGMVLRVDVIDRALQHVCARTQEPKRIVLLTPQGETYTQRKARQLSAIEHLVLVCGHYEGIDERVRDLVDEEISIGDYVLTGGEIPAMVLTDSITRLLPDVLAKSDATINESFEENMLEYPHYTRPETYGNTRVPAVLLSGNHKNITAWRQEKALERTRKRRPDLLLREKKDSV